ncbi:hypothetical protein [Sulfurospirillum sp. 1612]|uniref:hypothetical protein n=1 Tax=Sulfurospirillum sp. 1612 TaxID=3094835 RepID=UPI002F927E6B
MDSNGNAMLLLLPFLIIILTIVAINSIYYSDTKPKDLRAPKQIEKSVNTSIKTNHYIDKYIKE